MSKTFSQLVSIIDRNCKSNSVSFPIAEKVDEINSALDDVFDMAFRTSGRWQVDDTNHEKYPTISTTLKAGQRDYTFTTDEQGNYILDIYKVMIKLSPTGPYQEIFPVDMQSDPDMESFYDGLDVQGTPTRYDKTANGIILDYLPETEVSLGLKIFINREGSYFTVSDTTKKPGFAGLYHEYLALRPSYYYAMRNGLNNMNSLEKEMLKMEAKIKQHYRDRSKDETPTLGGEHINSV